MSLATLLALLANLSFSAAAISFAEYSQKYGSLWVNSFKSAVSLFVMSFLFIGFGFYANPVDFVTLVYLLSGFIGLAVGDYLLVVGFEKIGPARTLLLFGIQPILFLGIDKFYFKIPLSTWAPLGVALMLISLLLVFFERKKNTYSWSYIGFICGLSGVLLDFSGVLLTKWAMNQAEHDIIEVYFWRMLGALAGLLIFHLVSRKQIFKFVLNETSKQKWIFIAACISGTFISLWAYLKAIEIGPLSSVTAVAVAGPLFAGLFEWFFFKKPLTFNLLLALVFFGAGFYVLS